MKLDVGKDLRGNRGLTPFMDEIMGTPFPNDFKFPTMDRYDRSLDPEEYLTAFNA